MCMWCYLHDPCLPARVLGMLGGPRDCGTAPVLVAKEAVTGGMLMVMAWCSCMLVGNCLILQSVGGVDSVTVSWVLLLGVRLSQRMWSHQ